MHRHDVAAPAAWPGAPARDSLPEVVVLMGIGRRAVYLAVVLSAVAVAAQVSWVFGAAVAGLVVWAEANRCSFWR